MKGMVYIHVPFCKTRCIYCDFYSNVCGGNERRAYVRAACAELGQRADELAGKEVQSVYFGGGTPSLLLPEETGQILQTVRDRYNLSPQAEITLEANPDDITPEFVSRMARLGVNRMSLGVQSFNDETLRFLRRRHDARQAVRAVETIVEGGIHNVSIDLIFGLPGQSTEVWADNLRKAFSLPVTHLSSYALSIEDGAPLARLVDEGKITPIDEETYLAQYQLLMNECLKHGFKHYEISNFARPGFESRHNSGYWNETPYVGIGPGAHSFDGDKTRRMNTEDLAAYLQSDGRPAHELEHLTLRGQFNETVFTALRTCDGINLKQLRQRFPEEWCDQLLRKSVLELTTGAVETTPNGLRLTREGLFVSDGVMSDFMLLDEDE